MDVRQAEERDLSKADCLNFCQCCTHVQHNVPVLHTCATLATATLPTFASVAHMCNIGLCSYPMALLEAVCV